MIAVESLKKRADFLRANRAGRARREGLVLLAVESAAAREKAVARVGFTVTKERGNAVTRNRIKRRLRAAVREVLPRHGAIGRDYVVIGLDETLHRPFQQLIEDLRSAVEAVERGSLAPDQRPPRGRPQRRRAGKPAAKPEAAP